jgi:hypothetical protein
VADINERLDRLQRREEFDRFGRPLRHGSTEISVGPVVARPAGVDDRLGEVLDAVASVVRRHSGLSVMVALADGRAGRPVIRVTERDGSVETGVVVVGSSPPRPVEPTPRTEPPAEVREPVPAEYGPYDGLSTPAAAPARESVPGSDPVFEPALRDGPSTRDNVLARDSLPSRDGVPGRHGLAAGEGLPAREELSRDSLAPRDGLASRDSLAAAETPPDRSASGDGAASRDGVDPRESLASRDGVGFREGVSGAGAASGDGTSRDAMARAGTSRDGLPSREDVQSGREPDRRTAADGRHAATTRTRSGGAGWSGSSWHDALWSPESRDRFRQAEQDRQQAHEERGPAGAIPLPADTSQVVSRLAQLLRENPTLAASWSREAQE